MTLFTIQKASQWATKFLKEDVSPSNISYLVQYGRVRKRGENGSTLVALEDLKSYYKSYKGEREVNWKKVLGKDLNWNLSFDHLRERETTKHVHRLHPYKGKFIPQLVEYFLDDHKDESKNAVFFKKGDIVLDPFLGSGTTVVQANELGIYGVGIDISRFNCVISECKVRKYNLAEIKETIGLMLKSLDEYEADMHIHEFEQELLDEMCLFNNKYFSNPQFRFDVSRRKVDEDTYAAKKEKEFLPTYKKLVSKYKVDTASGNGERFLDKWFMRNVRGEIDFVFKVIKRQRDPHIRALLAVILSRTARSCRATTHSDLATLKEPQLTTYYCYKHKKICKPLFSIHKMLSRYTQDTFMRIQEFERIRSGALDCIITGDSRVVNIEKEISQRNPRLADIYKKQKIRGIFSSPPYVGQIDYHEQHAYAYDLFGFGRNDKLEIGPLYKGQGKEARDSYVDGIAKVLLNCKKYLAHDYDVFLVANDKWNLYPGIAELSGMKIVQEFKRPVLNRTERDRNPYSEIIFHMKEAG